MAVTDRWRRSAFVLNEESQKSEIMSLVGLIKEGTVSSILRSVAQTKSNAVLLMHRDDQFGHAAFREGTLMSAQLEALEGDEALQSLKQWNSGIYSVVKRQPSGDTEVSPGTAQVLVVGPLTEAHKQLRQWLRDKGFQISVVPYHEQAREVAAFLRPDVILLGCPPEGQVASCRRFQQEFEGQFDTPPLVILVGGNTGSCAHPNAACRGSAVKPGQVKHLLTERWPRIVYGEAPMAERRGGPESPKPTGPMLSTEVQALTPVDSEPVELTTVVSMPSQREGINLAAWALLVATLSFALVYFLFR